MEEILKKVIPVHEVDEYITALFYGRSGSGKTTLASTFPKKILLLDIHDKGTDSIRDVEGVDVLQVEAWDEIESIYWALTNTPHEYKTLVIDTVSNMQDLAIKEVRRRERVDIDGAMSQRLWGDTSRIMSQWIYAFRDLPLHVIFIAQERSKRGSEDENYDDQLDPEVGPAVMPSISKVITAAVKVIGNTYIRQISRMSTKEVGKLVIKTTYMLRVGPHPYYITKVRSPKSFKLPGSLTDPSFESIKALMRGENQEVKA